MVWYTFSEHGVKSDWIACAQPKSDQVHRQGLCVEGGKGYDSVMSSYWKQQIRIT